MVIEEHDERFLNFLTPSVLIVIGLLLLSIGAIGLLLANFFIPILSPDDIIFSIQLNLFGQIFGIIIMVIFLIPVFGVKTIETRAPTLKRLIKVLGVCCFAITFATFLAFVLWVVFTTLGLPIEHSYGSLVLTTEQLANPWNIVLFFTTATIGAALFEELIFRRTLIPTLEMRGMAPTAAVIASSLGFALVHVPNDVMNGSLAYVITHFATTFTIGLIFGFIYIFTRNVIFPIIIHGFVNFISFTELILININNFDWLIIYALIVLGVWIIGIIVGIFALVQYFRSPPSSWARIVRIKSPFNILPGLAGYLLIAFGLVSLQVMAELIMVLLFFPNAVFIYLGIFSVYLLLFFLLIWIIKHTQNKTTQEIDLKQGSYNNQMAYTMQEPPPE